MVTLLEVPSKKEVDQELVSTLEKFLEEVKSGDISSMAIAIAYQDGTSGNSFSTGYPVRLLGELELLKRDIIDVVCDCRLHKAGEEY